jgi:hypothetical protein
MENSRLRHTIRCLAHAVVAVVSVPVEAETALRTAAVNTPAIEAAYRLTDLLTPEIALLGGLVLLAFVVIARRPDVR